MPLKIRSKLLVAFFAILLPFTIIAGILVFYNASTFRKAAHKVETVSEERAAITNIILALERSLMPGNDYLITADRKYIDSNEKVTLVNKRGAKVLGYPEGETIGKNWFDEFLPERVRDEIKDVFRRLMRGEDGSLEYFENPVLTRSGEERIIAWHNTALKDDAGKIIATLSSGEDITDRKKAEEALKQRINELEQFRKVTIKRELRMEELQRKVDELEKELKRK